MTSDETDRSVPDPERCGLHVVIDLAAYRDLNPAQPSATPSQDEEIPAPSEAVWSRLRAAQDAVSSGRYRNALMMLIPLISTDTLDDRAQAKAHAQIGWTLMELRQYNAAADYLHRANTFYAAHRDRHQLEVLRALVVACCSIGAVEPAARYLDVYQAHTLARTDTNDLQAIVLFARGEHREARICAEQLLRAGEDTTLAQLVLAQLVLAQLDNQSGDHGAVIARWSELGRRDDDERLLREVAIAFEGLGDLASAYRYERLAADVAETRTLTLSMLGELIEADFGRFGSRRHSSDPDKPEAQPVAGPDPSETAMAVVQAEVDELHAVINEARRLRSHDEVAAHHLAAELEGYVTRMNQALEAARQPKPPSSSGPNATAR